MNAKFFLGANSGEGFFSLYDGFARDDGDFLYLIKGGPGCGKSGFMKKLRDKSRTLGFSVEEILCSGDPDSLDAIYINELKTGFCDATAPHIGEPRCFAVDSDYVNLGQFCAHADNERIVEYTKAYKRMYACAYEYLGALAKLKRSDIPGLFGENEIIIAKKRARSAVSRSIPKIGTSCGKSVNRFIRCISCKGELCLGESVSELCKQIYLADDDCGLQEYYLLEAYHKALERGHDVIVCPSPLCPERLDAVLIPDCSTGFAAASVLKGSANRHIRLDLLADTGANKKELILRREISEKLMNTAVGYLGKAKEYHDMLEAEYKKYMDFSALDEFTEGFARSIFGA